MLRTILLLTLLQLLPAAPALGQTVFGFGHVWTRHAPEIEARLDVVESLGGRAINVATGIGGLTQAQERRADAIVSAARARGIGTYIYVGGPWDSVSELNPTAVRAGGAAWGRWAAPNLDNVMGFGVLNEINLRVQGRARGAGEAEARALIAKAAELVVAFAEGVRSTCPRCEVRPGGLGGREIATGGQAAVAYMTALAPHIRSGLLSGLDTHWYRGGNDFTIARDAAGNVRATWKEDPTEIFDDLLRRAGWPRNTSVVITEANVRQTAFRSPEEAGAALRAMLEGLDADPRVKAIFLFSPFIFGERQLANHYQISPEAPVGRATREVTRRSGSVGGSPGGSASPVAEQPWYCRWFGLGCD